MSRLILALILVLTTFQVAADWFQRDDQIAAQALKNGQPEQAAELFQDAYRRGVAQYRAGQYREAEQSFKAAQQDPERATIHDDALFNQANSEFQLGDFAAAIRAYETLLKRDPDHSDARHNLRVTLRKLGKFLPEEPEQSKPEDTDEKEPEKKTPDQDKQSGESKSEDSEKSESGQSESQPSESDAGESDDSQADSDASGQSKSDPDESSSGESSSGESSSGESRQSESGQGDDQQASDSSASGQSSDQESGNTGDDSRETDKQSGALSNSADDADHSGEKSDETEAEGKQNPDSSSSTDSDSQDQGSPDKEGDETGKQGNDSAQTPLNKGPEAGKQDSESGDGKAARQQDPGEGEGGGDGQDIGDLPRDLASQKGKGGDDTAAPSKGQPGQSGPEKADVKPGPARGEEPPPPGAVDTFINQAVHLFDQLGLAGGPDPDNTEAAAPGDQSGGTEGLSDTLAEQMLDRVEGDPGTLLRRQFSFQEQRALAQRGQGMVEPRPW